MDQENKEELTDVVSNPSANESSSSSKSNTNVTLISSGATTATTSKDNVVDADGDSDTDADANVERLKSELTCSICMEMFVKATTLNCSHTFCEQCIRKWRYNHGICPICRVKIKTAYPTNVVDKCIDKVLESASDGVKRKRNELIEERRLVPKAKKRKVAVPVRNPNPIDVSSVGTMSEPLSEIISLSYSDVLNELREASGNSNRVYARRYYYCHNCGRYGHIPSSCPNLPRRRSD